MIASKVRTAIVAAGIALSMAAPMASAAPTAQIRDGYTLVELLPSFVGALGSLGIAPSKVLPGNAPPAHCVLPHHRRAPRRRRRQG